MATKVVSDSTSYIPRAIRERLDILIVGLSSELDGVSYPDDADDYGPFYTALAASDSFPTTSQPTLQKMLDALEGPVRQGREVVGVFISELMSGTYATALMARDMVKERNPEANIEIVDGKSNSMQLGYAAISAAEVAASGGTAREAAEAAEETTRHTRFLFTPMTLEYLRRGGRIGNASAMLGSLLQVKPVLTVEEGVTSTLAKVRTLPRALETIVETFAADVRAKGLREACVHHINDRGAGQELADRIAAVAGRAVELVDIGPAIGAHVGPGTVGVAYATVDRLR